MPPLALAPLSALPPPTAAPALADTAALNSTEDNLGLAQAIEQLTLPGFIAVAAAGVCLVLCAPPLVACWLRRRRRLLEKRLFLTTSVVSPVPAGQYGTPRRSTLVSVFASAFGRGGRNPPAPGAPPPAPGEGPGVAYLNELDPEPVVARHGPFATAGLTREQFVQGGGPPAPPTPVGLPPGWVALEDAEGDFYYWNESTGETTWSRPGYRG